MCCAWGACNYMCFCVLNTPTHTDETSSGRLTGVVRHDSLWLLAHASARKVAILINEMVYVGWGECEYVNICGYIYVNICEYMFGTVSVYSTRKRHSMPRAATAAARFSTCYRKQLYTKQLWATLTNVYIREKSFSCVCFFCCWFLLRFYVLSACLVRVFMCARALFVSVIGCSLAFLPTLLCFLMGCPVEVARTQIPKIKGHRCGKFGMLCNS